MNITLGTTLRVAGCLALVMLSLFAAHTPHSASAADEGVVRGVIWEDIDGDGRLDLGEPPVAFDRPIYLSTSAGGQFIAQTIPSSTGTYAFAPVAPGRYRVNLILDQQWIAVYPQRQFLGLIEIPVAVAANSVPVDIGLIRVTSLARFAGPVTSDGVPVQHPHVEAFVNGTPCSVPRLLPAFGGSFFSYTIAVASSAVTSGCAGELGAPITFRVNGQPIAETATWQPGSFYFPMTVPPVAFPSPARVGGGVGHQRDELTQGGAALLALTLVLTARVLGRVR